MTDEQYAWERMPPVGREFGSPDYDRLMTLDAMKADTMIIVKADKSTLI